MRDTPAGRIGRVIFGDEVPLALAIPDGFASVRFTHFGECNFFPTIYPGQTVRHECPTGPDADEYNRLERAVRHAFLAGTPDHVTKPARDRMAALAPSLDARANVIIEEGRNDE